MAKKRPGRPRKNPAPQAPPPAPTAPEESLEDQMALDNKPAPEAPEDVDTVTEEAVQAAIAAPAKILRPSTLRAMILESCGGDQDAAAQVDPFRFRLDRGLPNPLRRYRVTGKRPTKDGPLSFPADVEVEAPDESEAVRKALDAARVARNERHRWNLRVVCVEE